MEQSNKPLKSYLAEIQEKRLRKLILSPKLRNKTPNIQFLPYPVNNTLIRIAMGVSFLIIFYPWFSTLADSLETPIMGKFISLPILVLSFIIFLPVFTFLRIISTERQKKAQFYGSLITKDYYFEHSPKQTILIKLAEIQSARQIENGQKTKILIKKNDELETITLDNPKFKKHHKKLAERF